MVAELTSFSNMGPTSIEEKLFGTRRTQVDKGSAGFTNLERKCILVLLSLLVIIMMCLLALGGFAVYAYVECSLNCDWFLI